MPRRPKYTKKRNKRVYRFLPMFFEDYSAGYVKKALNIRRGK